MSTDHDDYARDTEPATYELGDDVTDLAAPDGRGEIVHSIILPDDQLDGLDVLSEASGQSYSEIVQDALRQYAPLRAYVAAGQ